MMKILTIIDEYEDYVESFLVDTNLTESELQDEIDKILDDFDKQGYDWNYDDILDELEQRGCVEFFDVQRAEVHI